MCGNTTERGDVGGSPGKSSLFFLTASYPGIRLPGDRVTRQGKHLTSWGVRCALDGPWKSAGQDYHHAPPYS